MRRLRRDGVNLFYEEAGVGEPPMLLVHGLACDHTHLTPQLEHFGGDHRIVAVDLRGHGQSDAPRQEYTIEGFADDLAWVCAQLGLENPIVVGHSLAGRICLELAASYPDLPSAIVALDSTIVPPRDRLEMMRPFIESLRTPAYQEELRRFFSTFFLPDADPERKARILAQVLATPQHVVASAWEKCYFAYDTAAAAAACRVPVLYIDAGTPNTDLSRFDELCPRLVTGKTVGAGHFLQLEVPDQVNAMIERFLAIALRDRSVASS
jgi:pimeloyl-ACP methyl ester carboxylesterase